MTDDNAQTYTFDSVQSLLETANRPELHADESPILAPDPNGDPDAPVGDLDGIAAGDSPEADPVALRNVDGFKLIHSKVGGEPWNAVSEDYTIINPQEFIGPLAEELRDRDRTDVTGDLYVRNGGGSVFGEVLFEDTHSIHLPDRGQSDPVRCGFTVRWSHDSGMSVRAEGFAQDTACKNSIRQVTSPIYVKHAGDVEDRVDWNDEWAGVLDHLGAFSETLSQVIEDAMGHTFFDFREDFDHTWLDATDPLDTLESAEVFGPITERDRNGVYAFYSLLGFPKYLAVSATDRLFDRLAAKDDPRDATAWDAYSAATYALTHEARGTPGASDDDKFRAVKDVLMNPEKALADANQAALAECSEDHEARPGTGVPMTEAELEGTTGEALRQYSERSRELEQSFSG